jgi:hypothetical protein
MVVFVAYCKITKYIYIYIYICGGLKDGEENLRIGTSGGKECRRPRLT